MPTVTLLTEPTDVHAPYGNTLNLPTNKCHQWVFEFADVLEEVGVAPTITLSFADGAANVDGETFVLMGRTFTVKTGLNGGDCVDLTSAIGSTNAINMRTALEYHPLFRDLIDVTIVFGGPTVLTITFLKPAEFPAMSFTNIDLSNPPADSAADTGTAASMYEGLEFIYRLELLIESAFQPICSWQHSPIILDADCNPLPLPVDVSYLELASLITFALPDTAVSTNDIVSDFKSIRMIYGLVTKRADSCGLNYCGIDNSTVMRVRAQTYDTSYGMSFEDYLEMYNTYTGQANVVKFLTTKPSGSTICSDHADWLYASISLANSLGITTFWIRCRQYNSANTEIANNTLAFSGAVSNSIVRIPTGPVNTGFTIDPDACSYDITIMADPATIPHPIEGWEASEVYTYKIVACKDQVPVYFYDKLGALTMIMFDKTTALEASEEMEEVCKGSECGASYSEMLISLKANFNSVQTRQTKLSVRGFQKNEAIRNFFMTYKASEAKFLLVDGEFKRYLIGSQTTRIFELDKYLALESTIIDAVDYKTLSGLAI